MNRKQSRAHLPEPPALIQQAMRDAADLPVTVKHRIGLDADESYGPVRDFVGAVSDAGCELFIVHARNAVLKGLSPKENREIPPLRYAIVRQLQRDFPELRFVLNGGLKTADQSIAELQATIPRRSQYAPGTEIPERSWAVRFAKWIAFNDFGAYGKFFKADEWIDPDLPKTPSSPQTYAIDTQPLTQSDAPLS